MKSVFLGHLFSKGCHSLTNWDNDMKPTPSDPPFPKFSCGEISFLISHSILEWFNFEKWEMDSSGTFLSALRKRWLSSIFRTLRYMADTDHHWFSMCVLAAPCSCYKALKVYPFLQTFKLYFSPHYKTIFYCLKMSIQFHPCQTSQTTVKKILLLALGIAFKLIICPNFMIHHKTGS